MKKLAIFLTLLLRKSDNVVLQPRRDRAIPLRPFRDALCLFLVVCLLAPSLSTAQPSPPGQLGTPRAPGSFAPTAPGRPDLGAGYGAAVRSIAGPEYRLGPGDVLDVQIAGRIDVTRTQVVIDPEGAVDIPPLGAIAVGGLTLLEANRKIAARAAALFRFADVTVAVIAPRAFEVVVSGEVERPGTLQAIATQRLHEVILTAGGVTPRGSVRHVEVSDRSGDRYVDLLVFELRGDLSQNPLVREHTKIHVPPRGPSVTLSGGVRRPGEYELDDEASLRTLLELTGGLAPTGAGSEARLTRVGPDGKKETVSVDLTTALKAPSDVRLQPGDALYVPPLTVLQDVVEVRGAFNGTAESAKTTTTGKPTVVQRLELAQGERVRDVVITAGGAAAFADLRQAFVERAGVSGPRQHVPIDLQRLLVEKDETQNVLLQNGDVVVLPVIEDKVYVVGEVKVAGAQDFRPNLTPREYVALAGGPGVRAKVGATTVTFPNGRTFAMAQAPPLEPGSVITVPEVSLKWWQDYVQLASLLASLVTAYTGIYLLLGGRPLTNN